MFNNHHALPTLATVFRDYTTERPLRLVTIKGYRQKFRNIADWQGYRLDQITSAMLRERHKKLTKDAPAMANDVVELIRQLYNFANKYYLDSSDQPLLNRNPANLLIATKSLNPTRTKVNDFIKDEDLFDWWRGVKNLRSRTASDYLIFLLLTGLRRESASSIRFDQVNFEASTILFDAEQMKNAKFQELPVSRFVLSLIQSRKQWSTSKYLFSGRNGAPFRNPSGAVEVVRKVTSINFTCHSLRRTFSRILANPECSADELEIKALISHVEASATWQHYLRLHPERLRPAVQSVSDFVLRRVQGEQARRVGLIDLGGSSVWLSDARQC